MTGGVRFGTMRSMEITGTARLSRLTATLAAIALSGCASTHIPTTTLTESDPEAVSIVTASQRAHGAEAFAAIRDLKVNYLGKWGAIGPRLQPVLSDRRYRRESEEALDLGSGSIVQLHKGSGGRKFVFRGPGRVSVWYNGQPDADQKVIRAAALVADAYKMFLLGPHYFQRPGVILEKLEPGKIGSAEVDRVLATLRPGFGFATEDRVVLSIDKGNQRLRRVLMTLSGLESTKGAEVDVTFDRWVERSGVWWATDYVERIRAPLKLHAHRWRLMDLKANKGFAPNHPELLGEAVSEALKRAE
jgi:hypothetical protein